MTKIDFISDLHVTDLCTNIYKLFEQEKKDTYLLLGGDNCFNEKHIKFLCGKYKAVVAVLGNHDLWGMSYKQAKMLYAGWAMKYSNFVHLDNNTLNIDGAAIHGTPLWTDFKFKNPVVINECGGKINDFKEIKTDKGEPITPDAMAGWNEIAIEFLRHSLPKKPDKSKKHIVLSHFSPAFCMSGYDVYQNHTISEYFSANSAWKVFEKSHMDYWLFGHTHVNYDEVIGNVRFICNCSVNNTGQTKIITLEI